MALGPGKYDDECTRAREATHGEGVLLIVLGGSKGTGFACQVSNPAIMFILPRLLRTVADELERSGVQA